MAKQVIDVGTSASDGTGDPLREAFTKINENFTELYSTVENEGLTYGNISSNVAGVTFNVTRYTESYAASPVLEGTGQVVGNVYLIRGNVLGGTTPLNDVLLTVTSLANVTVGNIATVSAVGVPVAPVLRVNGLTGNVDLTVNNIPGAASKAYVNAAIAANIATVTGNVTNSLNANITAANAVISNHTARIATLESNSAAQASQINNLVSVKANVSYVDTSIDNALSSNAILANVQSVNANVAAANAAILLRANLSGAAFTGNISANAINATNAITTNTYMIGGSEAAYGLTIPWGNPAAMFFGNSAGTNNKYYQINLQNLDPEGSGDIVVTSDDGADTENYIAFGISGSQSNDPLFPSTGPHDGYVYINGGNLDLQSNTGNIELIAGNLVTGQVILTTSNILKLGPNVGLQFADGTIQSTAFGGNTNVASINANITAANAAITALQANAAAQALDIDSLTANAGSQATTINTLVSNAATQATSLNSINANVGAFQTFANANAAAQATSINTINANVTAANINITALLSNAAIQAQELDNLIGNAQSQQGNIIALQSNSAAQGTQINLLNANVSAANTNITALTSNSATQGTQINLLNANVSAANVNISNLQTNAATQALQLDNLQTNVNTWYSSIAATNANVAAANARIVTLDANLGSTSTNVSALQNNVLDLVANKANVSGSTVFSGNLTASYLLANNSVKVGTTVEVGESAPVAYPDLAAVFIGNVDGYYQLVLQNVNSSANASGDIVITADDGDNTNYYIDIGINSSNFSGNFEVPAGDTGVPEFAHDGYVTTIGGNLFLRTDSNVYLLANTVYAGLVKDGNFTIFNTNLEFSDGSVQSTAVTDVPGLLANVDSFYNDIITIDANIGSIDNYLDYIEANIGSFQTYTNTTFTTLSYTNANVQTYLAAFDSNIVPSANVSFDLGSSTNRWRDLWLSGNTIYIGQANITANGSAITLPPGSTIDGAPISSGADDELRANVGAYQIYANANAASQQTTIDAFDANLGSFQTYANLTFGAGSYGNSEVAAYLVDNTVSVANLITTNGVYWSNGAAYSTGGGSSADNVLRANVGAYQTWANTVGFVGNIDGNNGLSYFGSNVVLRSTTDAATQEQIFTIFTGNTGGQISFAANGNVLLRSTGWIESIGEVSGPFPKFNVSNWDANIGTLRTNIDTVDANVGAYQTYANANAATQATSIDSINANVGAYQTYANATFGGGSYNDSNVQTYLGQFDGNIVPSANITYDLGSSTNRWKDLWLSGNTIYIGDATLTVANGAIQSSIPLAANISASNITVSGTRINFASGGNIEETEVLDGNLQPAGYYGIAINSSDDGIVSINALDSNAAVTSSIFVTNVNVQLNVANSTPGGNAYSWYLDNVGNLTIPGHINYANGASILSGIGGGGSFGNADVKTYLESLSNVSIGLGTGINQGTESVAIGKEAGTNTQGNLAIAIGPYAGADTQSSQSIAIGTDAGRYAQGYRSIAIGYQAGYLNQPGNSIVISANGQLNNNNQGFYVDPVRNLSTLYYLYYDPTFKEITYAAIPTSYSNTNVAAYLTTGNVQLGNSGALGAAVGNIVIASNTGSTNSTTGALVVRGGVGIAGVVNIGSYLGVTSFVGISSNLQASTIDGTSALYVNGGVTIRTGNLYISGSGGNAIVARGSIQPQGNLVSNIGSLTNFWSNIFVSTVVGNVSYTPANAANYNGTITNIQQALDELAARIKALGG